VSSNVGEPATDFRAFGESGKNIMKRLIHIAALSLLAAPGTVLSQTQTDPQGYSIATPRPINPAASTTNPSALATQTQNPYLGSTPSGKVSDEVISLSLRETVERGLHYNLGLIESNQGSAEARAERLRALSALLPQLSVKGEQAFENISFQEVGLDRLPPIPGVGRLPVTSGNFGYQDTRVSLTQSVYSAELHDRYRAQRNSENASVFSTRDARDVVVYAVCVAYLQVAASVARAETANAQLNTARQLDQQTRDQVRNEVSPEIDSVRAQVEFQTAEQRLVNAANALEKDKLTLGRIIGLPIDQKFALADAASYRSVENLRLQAVTSEALQLRSDLRSAEANVRAAEYAVGAEKAQRYPTIALNANYGGAGVNVGSFNSVYAVSGNISLPIFTGGRIRADIEEAEARLQRRRAEYEDLKGRVAYDVRVAWLDLEASDSGVKVAEKNEALAERALTQSRDRYGNGVTNYLEVIQAQEAVTAARENYIQSLYSFNVAKAALARSMGVAERRFAEFFGGK
jgi:outer membrane protein TolC